MTWCQSCPKVKSKILSTCNLVELVSNLHNKTRNQGCSVLSSKAHLGLINPDTFVHGLKEILANSLKRWDQHSFCSTQLSKTSLLNYTAVLHSSSSEAELSLKAFPLSQIQLLSLIWLQWVPIHSPTSAMERKAHWEMGARSLNCLYYWDNPCQSPP